MSEANSNRPKWLKAVDVPEGKSGDWEVKKTQKTNSKTGKTRRNTHLICCRHTIMADIDSEFLGLDPFYEHLKGQILITGLGLGVAVQGALDHPAVEHVTVVEISPDVITLVGGHYQERYGNRLTIVQADAHIWEPPKGVKYDAAWHDIWPTETHACANDWLEVKNLQRHYEPWCVWQGSWPKDAIERDKAAKAQTSTTVPES